MRRWDGIIDASDMSLSKRPEVVKDREAWRAAVHGVAKSWTRLSDCTTASRFREEGGHGEGPGVPPFSPSSGVCKIIPASSAAPQQFSLPSALTMMPTETPKNTTSPTCDPSLRERESSLLTGQGQDRALC